MSTCLAADSGDEVQGFLAGVVHADHLFSPLGGLLALLHHLVLVSCRVDHGKEVRLYVLFQLLGGRGGKGGGEREGGGREEGKGD